MQPNLRYALLGLVLITVALMLGCGGSGAPQQAQQGDQQRVLPPLPAVQPGVGMPTLPPDDFDVDNPDKAASAVYRVFFRDTVNHQSGGRWSTTNTSGQKIWQLSNTNFSAPKAWILGGNYWNREDDELTSTGFDVEDGADGLALSFYSRWSIAAGDTGTVFYWDGDSWEQVVVFTAGANPSYPAWDKYYFQLPANTSGNLQSCNINFHFQSDTAGNDWGFGVDSAAVYQTQLGDPLNLDASDGGLPGEVALNWDHNNVGNLVPGGYDIYRADDNAGVPDTYAFLDSVTYPSQAYGDMTGNGDPFWYKVVATKTGWPDSPDSNEDYGFGIGTWMTVEVDSDDTGPVSLALINGFPAIASYQNVDDDLNYFHTNVASGASGWTQVSVDATGIAGFDKPSLAEINGFPAFSFFSDAANDLGYARSTVGDGSSGWSTIIINATGVVGPNSSLTTVNGTPAISYADGLADLLYAYSDTADGAVVGDWNLVNIEVAAVNTGQGTSLAVINGFPGIAHGDNTNGSLRFDFSSQADGSSGWTSVVVDNANGQPASSAISMALLGNGNPGIAYQTGSSVLRFTYSSTADGTDALDWTNLAVDAVGTTGEYAGLVVAYGKPGIGYRSNTNGDLLFASSTAVDGSSGWSSVLVDGDGAPGGATVGEFASTALINGKPAIAYRDTANTALMFAWYE